MFLSYTFSVRGPSLTLTLLSIFREIASTGPYFQRLLLGFLAFQRYHVCHISQRCPLPFNHRANLWSSEAPQNEALHGCPLLPAPLKILGSAPCSPSCLHHRSQKLIFRASSLLFHSLPDFMGCSFNTTRGAGVKILCFLLVGRFDRSKITNLSSRAKRGEEKS